jgi:hypothetical protein
LGAREGFYGYQLLARAVTETLIEGMGLWICEYGKVGGEEGRRERGREEESFWRCHA